MTFRVPLYVFLAVLLLSAPPVFADAYDPPANYYSAATGAGATLKSQLRTIVSTGFRGINYENAKHSAAITDADPNTPGNILLIYTRASVPGAWSSGGTVWNREHIWPDSRLGPGANDPSPGEISVATDQFNLRPSSPSANSSHNNKNFTGTYGPSGYGSLGATAWYPGAADAGDVARAAFYMATRYSHLNVVDGTPAATDSQLGDRQALIRYHYLDTPDDFERRRNQAIYSSALNPLYYQNNRNPYVDRPEYAWSVFMDQQNDTRLHVGASANADGSSQTTVTLGPVIVGAAIPGNQNVTLNKKGFGGTYYSVTTTGAATSSVTGRYNAFAMDAEGSRTLSVGLNASTATAGLKTGQVVIDNLDVTTQGGAGRGANDGNDTITVNLSVLNHANASFSNASDQNTFTLDFGDITQGASSVTQTFDVWNLVSSAGAAFTAGLDLDTFSATGDAGAFSLDLASFAGLDAGSRTTFTALLDTLALGSFDATYTLNFSDENIAGAANLGSLQVRLLADVVAVPEPAAAALLSLAVLALARRPNLARNSHAPQWTTIIAN